MKLTDMPSKYKCDIQNGFAAAVTQHSPLMEIDTWSLVAIRLLCFLQFFIFDFNFG